MHNPYDGHRKTEVRMEKKKIQRRDEIVREAFDEENDFIEHEVLGQGALDSNTDRQNLMTQIEKTLEGDVPEREENKFRDQNP